MMKCVTSTCCPIICPSGVREMATASAAMVRTTATVVTDVSRMPQRNAAASKAKMKYRKNALLGPPAKRLMTAGQRMSVAWARIENRAETAFRSCTTSNRHIESAS